MKKKYTEPKAQLLPEIGLDVISISGGDTPWIDVTGNEEEGFDW